MTRSLDTATLDAFARRMSLEWRREQSLRSETIPKYIAHLKRFRNNPFITDAERVELEAMIASQEARTPRWLLGPDFVLQEMYNLTYKDEFDYVHQALMDKWFTGPEKTSFEGATKKVFEPRQDKVLEDLLKNNLAISPAGDHIDGQVGRVEVGTRLVNIRTFEVEARWSLMRRKEKGLPYHLASRTDRDTIIVERRDKWPIYIGEGIERANNPDGESHLDPLPEGTLPLSVGALAPQFSAEVCIGMLDFFDTSVNEGTTAATIRHRTGAQPADPDASETGTLLGTNTMSDPAFGAAADDADGTCSLTASAITDDSSADATGTASYFRMGATGTGADDHLDGTIGTGTNDLVMNTVSYTAGSTISITAFVVNLSQGSTAT